MSLRDSRWWNREFEGGLPDSRLSGATRENKTFTYARMTFEMVFCANCGKYGGGVTAEFSPHVFYLCDDCVMKSGVPPGTIEVKPG